MESFKTNITPKELKEEILDCFAKLTIIKKHIDDLYKDFSHDIMSTDTYTKEVIEYYHQFDEVIRLFNLFFNETKIEFIDNKDE